MSGKNLLKMMILVSLIIVSINLTAQFEVTDNMFTTLKSISIAFFSDAYAARQCMGCGGNWWAGCPERWMICCYGGYATYGGACHDYCTFDGSWDEPREQFKIMCV
jgi:hypothetical protein